MIKYESCVRCGSSEIDKLAVNTCVKLNYPKKKDAYSTIISQRVITPTDALVCKKCGHVEFFIDWDKR